jgi:hypothetical protein
MKINRAHIEFFEGSVPIEGKPTSANEGALEVQIGQAHKFRVTTTDDLNHIFALVTWPDARPEVRSIEFIDGLSKYKRLEGAGRWSLIPVNNDYWLGELNVMKFNTKDYPTLCRASAEDLNLLAGRDAFALMLEHGVTKIGTREELIGDKSRQRNAPAVLFKAEDVRAAACAFALTRVMAIMFDLGLEDE